MTVKRKYSLARLALHSWSLVVGLFLLLPTLVVVPLSFTDQKSFHFPPSGWSTRWYERFFNDPQWYESALFSLRISLLVTVLATALGTIAAMHLTRADSKRQTVARAFLLSPMIVPGIITAVGISYVFTKLGLTQTLLGFVLAHTVLAIPFVVVTVSASMQSFDRQLVVAAASLGAGPVQSFARVTLPLIAPGVLSGALFAFLTSFDEAIISLFLAGPFTRTLPIQIYQSVTAEIDPTIAAAATMLLALTTIFLQIFAFIDIKNKRR